MAECGLAPSAIGSVVLDIGEDVGALLVEFPSQFLGEELDLTPLGATVALMHGEVRARDVGYAKFAVLYSAVPAGTYILEGSEQQFEVKGGRVTAAVWDGMTR